jgi:hypothetical protein
MQGGKNCILPKDINANQLFRDSHWLEIWRIHFCPSMGPNRDSHWLEIWKNHFCPSMGPNGDSHWLEIWRNHFCPSMGPNGDSHWLEIWKNHFCPSMGPNRGSVGKKKNSPTHLVEEPGLFVKVGKLALVNDIGRHHLLQLPLLGGRHPGHLLLRPDKLINK